MFFSEDEGDSLCLKRTYISTLKATTRNLKGQPHQFKWERCPHFNIVKEQTEKKLSHDQIIRPTNIDLNKYQCG